MKNKIKLLLKTALRGDVTITKVRKSAYGGDISATAKVSGDKPTLLGLFSHLGEPAEIWDGMKCVWRGQVHEVEAAHYHASLSEVRNACRGVYKIGDDVFYSAWIEDQRSIDTYGRREYYTKEQATRLEADTLAQSILDQYAAPSVSIKKSGDGKIGTIKMRGEWAKLDHLYLIHQPDLTIDAVEPVNAILQPVGLSGIAGHTWFIEEEGKNHILDMPYATWEGDRIQISNTLHHNGTSIISKIDDSEDDGIKRWYVEEVEGHDFKYEEAFATFGPNGKSIWEPLRPSKEFFVSEIRLKVGRVGHPVANLNFKIGAAGPSEVGLSRVVAEGVILASEFHEDEELSLRWIGVPIPNGMNLSKRMALWVNVYADYCDPVNGYIVEVDSQYEEDNLLICSDQFNQVALRKERISTEDKGFALVYEITGSVSVKDLLSSALKPLFKSVSLNFNDYRTSKLFDQKIPISKVIIELLAPLNTDSKRVVCRLSNGHLVITQVSAPNMAQQLYNVETGGIENRFNVPIKFPTVGEWIGYKDNIKLGAIGDKARVNMSWIDISEWDEKKGWKPTKLIGKEKL